MQKPRHSIIIEHIEKHGASSFGELADIADTSEITIRRDVKTLENKGVLLKTSQGIILNQSSYIEKTILLKSREHEESKKRIGEYAASLIQSSMAIGIDGGSTTWNISRALKARAGSLEDISIVTNAMHPILELSGKRNMKKYVCGGNYREDNGDFTGPEVVASLSKYHLDIAFIGIDGMMIENGVYANHTDDSVLIQTFASVSEKVIIVADSSKINKKCLYHSLGLEEISMVITDSGINPHSLEQLKELVEVVTV